MTPQEVDALRTRHTVAALKRCESCGAKGARPSLITVFDSLGVRSRYMCKDPDACAARLMRLMRMCGRFTGKVEQTKRGPKKEYLLDGSARKLLLDWKTQCHRGVPPWAL